MECSQWLIASLKNIIELLLRKKKVESRKTLFAIGEPSKLLNSNSNSYRGDLVQFGEARSHLSGAVCGLPSPPRFEIDSTDSECFGFKIFFNW